MSLTVIGGHLKGRKIMCPPSLVRPTSAKMRSSIFNIVQQEIDQSFFLDLYAGSGAMGIEALSRGANFSVFIEKKPYNAKILKKNLDSLGLSRSSKVICADVLDGITHLIRVKNYFSIVFIDPPYKESDVQIPLTLSSLASCQALIDEAHILIEQEYKKSYIAIESAHFSHLRSRKYGNSALHEYRHVV